MKLDNSSSLEGITHCYTRPSEEQAYRLLCDLEQAENYGFLTFAFRDVMRSERIPWNPLEHIVDSCIQVSTLGEKFLFSCQGKKPLVSGSGVHEDRIFGSVHACSEALERLAARFEGQAELRPSPHAAWSVKRRAWIDVRELDSEPFQVLSAHRSGEAFHVIPGEATRAALCELIEKDFIYKLLAKKEDVCVKKITKQASLLSKNALNAIHGLKKVGHQVEFFHGLTFEGIHVVIALSRNHSASVFRNGFKGSGADFSLPHALDQAVSELGRAHFMGKPSAFQSPDEALKAISNGELTQASLDITLLLFPENRQFFSHLFDIDDGECINKQVDTKLVLKSITDLVDDIFIIPLASRLYGINGIVTKILIPGYSNIPQISTLLDLENYKISPS